MKASGYGEAVCQRVFLKYDKQLFGKLTRDLFKDPEGLERIKIMFEHVHEVNKVDCDTVFNP